MNKRIIIFFVVLTFFLQFNNVNAAIEDSLLKFSVINQNPDPAYPGSVVDLRIRVDNIGLEKADSYNYEIVLDKGFSVLSDKIVSKGSLDGYQQGSEGAVLFWKIKLSEDLDGSDTYTFRIKYFNDKKTLYTQPFSLRISDLPLNIILKNISYNFDSFKPGSEGKIILDFENFGSKIFYSLNSKVSSEVLSFKNDVVEKSYLKPKEEAVFEHDVFIKPDVKPGVYPVNIVLSFVDENGVLKTKSYNSNIKDFEKPDYFLSVEDSSSKVKGKGKLVVSISNRGSETLKYTLLTLEKSEDYDILSPNNVYVGNLESDDFETAEYNVYFKNPGVIPLKVKVSFKDSFGNVYEDSEILNYNVYDFKTAEKYGFASKNNSIYFVLILLLFVLLFFYFKSKNKKLKKIKH